jgi:acyl-CoA synthetase (AMP-forming)/AMP-acid ligase II
MTRVVDLLERAAAVYPRHDAVIVHGGQRLTYAQLHARVRGFAAGMASLGVQRGDRVALLVHNGLPFFDVYLGCAYLGAAATPVSTRLAAAEVAYQLGNAEPALVIADAEYALLLAMAPAPPCGVLYTDSPAYRAMCDTPAPAGIGEQAHGDDVALIIYTSGTTGKPKGACLTQANLCANAMTIALGQRLVHEDVFMSMTPLYHAATGTRVVTTMIDAQTHVVLREFSVDACLDAIEQHRVSTLIAVPTQLRRILDAPDLAQRDLSSMRLLTYGAAPTVPPLIRRALQALPCGLYQGYGLSESTSAVSGLLPSDHADLARLDLRLTSCGRPLPGVRVRICRDDGGECADDEVGEICVRSDNVMAGYWRNPQATAEALRDGWLRTGDLGRRDAEGYLYIAGRAKEMLISGGVNVYPREIEAAISEHPAVAEVAVVGVADEEWGEVPVAFVLAREGEDVDPDALRAFCAERLARIKVPRRVVMVTEFPRTDSGKVRKFALVEKLHALS